MAQEFEKTYYASYRWVDFYLKWETDKAILIQPKDDPLREVWLPKAGIRALEVHNTLTKDASAQVKKSWIKRKNLKPRHSTSLI